MQTVRWVQVKNPRAAGNIFLPVPVRRAHAAHTRRRFVTTRRSYEPPKPVCSRSLIRIWWRGWRAVDYCCLCWSPTNITDIHLSSATASSPRDWNNTPLLGRKTEQRFNLSVCYMHRSPGSVLTDWPIPRRTTSRERTGLNRTIGRAAGAADLGVRGRPSDQPQHQQRLPEGTSRDSGGSRNTTWRLSAAGGSLTSDTCWPKATISGAKLYLWDDEDFMLMNHENAESGDWTTGSRFRGWGRGLYRTSATFSRIVGSGAAGWRNEAPIMYPTG